MSKAILLLSAVTALAVSAPALAQSYERSSASGSEHSVVQAGSSYEASAETVQVDGARSANAQAYGTRAYESESSDFQSSQSSSFQSGSYDARAYANRQVRVRIHHTTDTAGYLTWAGKTDDLGPGDDGHRRPGSRHGDDLADGPACPTAHGERVLSCHFVSFAPPPQAIHINDEDFAYEGGVGPAFLGDNGGGGGGGGGSAEAFAGGSASASASAFASVSVSARAHFGGHYGGHGGGHWGHMGGGHPKSGCGCKR